MKWIKLTAFTIILFSFVFSIGSCEKESEKKKITDFSRSSIPMTGAQETPATTSAAVGSMDVFYSKNTHTLTYTVNWSGLTGNATAMHIHGLAPVGFAAAVFQTFSGFKSAVSGSYSGFLFIDGVAIKEQDLLNGLYYINIHTAANPNGEIRGQIVFQ